MSDVEHHGGISRRTLVKSTAIGSLALAAGGLSLPFGLKRAAAAVQNAVTPADDKVVWGACSVNCGSRCALRLHVRDDEVYWVETDNTGDDVYGNHQVRACLRGRSIRRRINHPDRLNYPMKRVGKRGEGKFERISWDEALNTITDSLKHVVEKYGNEAVYINYSSGIVGGNITRSSPYASLVARLMNCYGGFLSHYGTYSTAQIACAMPYTYGSNDGNSTSDIENTKLVVMFGNNPAETRMSGGGITYYLEQARERSNARMIVIDPRYTDTAAGREDEWIPIRPGTDAALVAGLAWVLINETSSTSPSSITIASATMKKRCRKARLPTAITKPIFSVRAMIKRRKPLSGRRASPAFLRTVSLSLPGKLARRNRPIFARAGGHSVRLTAS
ncbi:DmsA/YnfE family anaerobic dimethyl sulfoxide reductase subunit A [Enterobacter cancerogenus]|uniref:DmsA/YnfE family anaerobic dimethyl sulfoxide reductase subunit A n=1 Tax=Enterobacter cancerogenus TaxID=69218 RepID=A0A484Z3X2_9ENTR|nr:DmsA/YnfE family anaerobic dimethyl sulfoxide reductase subunit A [Enterobacter cancerogenus]